MADENGRPPGGCNDAGSALTHNLSGNLGVDQIINGGVAEIQDANNFNVPIKPPGGFAGDGTTTTKYPNFGSTVQFMLTATFDTGPTWTLTNFKGPSGGKGIFNGGRITTDSVIFAFAAGAPPDPKKIAALRSALEQSRAFAIQVRTQPIPKGFVAQATRNLQQKAADADVASKEFALEQAESGQAPGAAAAAQGFTTNMILQNLSGQLH